MYKFVLSLVTVLICFDIML